MSKSVEIELNSAGIRALLRSAEMGNYIGSLASGIAGRAGAGYSSDTKLMPGRVIASAFTDSPQAAKDNSEHNTLLRALQ